MGQPEVCKPSGAVQGADVVRRRGSGGRAERATSGQENLLWQLGGGHVPHASLEARSGN